MNKLRNIYVPQQTSEYFSKENCENVHFNNQARTIQLVTLI